MRWPKALRSSARRSARAKRARRGGEASPRFRDCETRSPGRESGASFFCARWLVLRVHHERWRIVTAAALERYPARLRELIDTLTTTVAAKSAPANAPERHVRLVV